MLLIETITGLPAARTSQRPRARMVSEATAEPPPESIRSSTASTAGSSAMSSSVVGQLVGRDLDAERAVAAADQPRRADQGHGAPPAAPEPPHCSA